MTNNGNQAVGLFFKGTTFFSFDPAKAFALAPGASKVVTASTVATAGASEIIKPETSPALCAPAAILISKAQ